MDNHTQEEMLVRARMKRLIDFIDEKICKPCHRNHPCLTCNFRRIKNDLMEALL